jgi:hypothetical protein
MTTKSKQQKNRDVRDMGRRGGRKTLEKYGREHFRKAARSRWKRSATVFVCNNYYGTCDDDQCKCPKD